MKFHQKRIFYLALALVAVIALAVPVLVMAADGDPVTVDDNGSRLVARVDESAISAPYSYQWQKASAPDGTFTDLGNQTERYYDITAADETYYIRVVVNGEESAAIGPIGKLIVFDLAKGNITLNSTYSGKDSEGNTVSGKHDGGNIYVIEQSDNATATTNGITINGNMPNHEYDVTLAGINIYGKPAENKMPGDGGTGATAAQNINIPDGNNVKKVILRLKGENITRNIHYSCKSNEKSSLKITNINGDGVTEGGSLYVPKKFTPEEEETYINSKQSYNHWNSAIGGDDGGGGNAYNMELAGGYIRAVTSFGDNCTAIGAGGNDVAEIDITGGEIVAICNGTGTAIGGGIGWNSSGGSATVNISGGNVFAANLANIDWNGNTVGGVAIGGGSSFHAAGNTGTVTVNISGGTVTAQGAFGNGIGGGNSSTSTGGSATVKITGGTVNASSIGGGNSQKGQAGNATVTVDGKATVTLSGGIGGGDSVLSGNGGAATVTVNGGRLNCGGIIGGGNGAGDTGVGGNANITVNGGVLITEKEIGGGNGAGTGAGGAATIHVNGGELQANAIGGGIGGASGNGGDAKVTVKGGTLHAAHEIGGGRGGSTSGNGGAAEITVEDGIITAGTIGGGPAGNPTGSLGYAKATISGGDISAQFLLAAGGTEPCSFIMTGGILHDIDATNVNYTYHDGAVVYMNDPQGVVNISGGVIENCRAADGGAIYMSAGTFTMSNAAQIRNCSATDDGGAIYVGGGTVNIAGGSITGNTAAANGGAAYLADGKMHIQGGSITGNTAAANGGAAYLGGGVMNITGGVIGGTQAGQKNTAANGAGVYLSGGTLQISGGEIIGNEASTAGGGAYLGGGVLKMSSPATVSSNKAPTGGAAYVNGGDVVIYGGSMTQNEATGGDGGAVSINNGNFYMYGGVLDNNSASGRGGALYISALTQSVSASVLSGSVQNNHADGSGGAIAVQALNEEFDITVSLGVNQPHRDSAGTVLDCPHADDSAYKPVPAATTCPIITNNESMMTGGAVYITGSKRAHLNIYCLEERGNQAENEETSRSKFMMVEGGQVIITTADPEYHDVDTHGHIDVQGSVHVTGGDLYLYGSFSNPSFGDRITVDIQDETKNKFVDNRYGNKQTEGYYTVTYYENSKDDQTGVGKGQYTLYQEHTSTEHVVSGSIYDRPGFNMTEWHMSADGVDRVGTVDGVQNVNLIGYQPTDSLKFKGFNYVLYAQWERSGYTVKFQPGIPAGITYAGETPNLECQVNVASIIPENGYVYPGYLFRHWYFEKTGKSYQPGEEFLNFSAVNDDVVELYAVWDTCDHIEGTHDINGESYTVSYTYRASGNVMYRDCCCGGYTESVTLKAPVGAVYSGARQGVTLEFSNPSTGWQTKLTESAVIYQKDGSTQAPVNAGDYTALLTLQNGDEPVTAEVEFPIAKATQQTPNIPEYTPTPDGAFTKIAVTPNPLDATPKVKYQYGLSHYTGSGWTEIDWSDSNNLSLSIAYTTYRVYVRYGGNDNYLPSEPAQATQMYYYEVTGGTVSLVIDTPEGGIDAHFESREVDGVKNLYLIYQAADGYYMSKRESLSVATTGAGAANAKLSADAVGVYRLYDIPAVDKAVVTVTIIGANKNVSTAVKGTVNREFADFNDLSLPTIARDSAFTLQFTIRDLYGYTNPSLTFSKGLPGGTSIVMALGQGVYYYTFAPEGATKIALSSMTLMGGSTPLSSLLMPPVDYANRVDLAVATFIIDFSKTTTSISADSLTVSLTADKVAVEPNIPNFPAVVKEIALKDVSFALSHDATPNNAGLTQGFSVTFAQSQDQSTASKWERRKGAIVLTPVQQEIMLPSDAHIFVREGNYSTTCYLSNGVFIVPLMGSSEEITIELQSEMFPAEMTAYLFNVQMMASNSDIAASPLNGSAMGLQQGQGALSVTFTSQQAVDVALEITGESRLYKPATGSMCVQLAYAGIPEAYTVKATVLRRNAQGVYVSTLQEISNIFEDPNSWQVISGGGDSTTTTGPAQGVTTGKLTISLLSQREIGNYCLMLEVKDRNKVTVMQVPYYFILSSQSS